MERRTIFKKEEKKHDWKKGEKRREKNMINLSLLERFVESKKNRESTRKTRKKINK